MRYNVIFKTGKVMSFFVREVAEMYASIYGGTLISVDAREQDQPSKAKAPSIV